MWGVTNEQRNAAEERAREILGEHFTYQAGNKGRDERGDCLALKAIADAICEPIQRKEGLVKYMIQAMDCEHAIKDVLEAWDKKGDLAPAIERCREALKMTSKLRGLEAN